MLDIDEFKRNPSIKFNYNYFVDNEPTKFVDDATKAIPSAVKQQVAKPDEAQPAPAEEEEEEKEPNKTMPIIFGVIAGVIVIIAIFVGVLLFKNGQKVTVPNFVGLNYNDEIMSNSEYTDNFKFETQSVFSTDVEAGKVIKQTPDADSKVRKGKTIKLEIAYNDQSIQISGIMGLSVSEAEAKLKQSGFQVKTIVSYNKNATPGVVYEIYPSEAHMQRRAPL